MEVATPGVEEEDTPQEEVRDAGGKYGLWSKSPREPFMISARVPANKPHSMSGVG